MNDDTADSQYHRTLIQTTSRQRYCRLQEFELHRRTATLLDDDELIQRAKEKIAQWKAAGTPSLTQVQELFHDSICAGASAMARDKIIAAIIAAFGTELGGKRAMVGTWEQIAKDFAAECAQDARENTTQPELTPEQKAAYGKRCGRR